MEVFLTILSLVLIVFIIFFVWYYFLGETGELKQSKQEFELFGLKDNFVPQGITYLKKQKKFLISGYVSKKHEASRIYVVDKETYAFEKFVTLKFATGKLYNGHAGGIASFGDSCWVSSEGRAYRFLLDDLLKAKSGDSIRIIDSLNTRNNADFCFVHDDHLWVGEFYKLGKFPTDINHHILHDDGTSSHAVAFGFKLSPCVTCGVESDVPDKALSLPDIAQGVVVSGDRIFVSCSYAISNSAVYEYKNVFFKKSKKLIIVDEQKVQLFELDSSALVGEHVLPEMSEEIELVDDRIFIVFESASNKYKFITRTRLNHVFSIKK